MTENDDSNYVLIPSGTFRMGDYSIYPTMPVHEVTIKSFFLNKYLVKQGEWIEVMGDNPSYHKGDELPIENVSWEEVKEFIKIKNNIDKDGYKYRLPSEAEWEYACCVGTTTLYFFGELCLDLDYYACYSGIKNMKAWYACGKICSHTIRVGQKLPNLWGLYDMYGNVSEWVQDIAHPDYRGAPVDGSPREESDEIEGWRIARGGSWYDPADTCNSRCRHSYLQNMKSPYVGFRLVRFKEEDQII